MRRSSTALVLALALAGAPLAASAAGPTVQFTLPATHATPAVFGSLPFPNDLYFDQGAPGNGDGTLLNAGATAGLGTDVIRTNTASVSDALDLMDGFGTTTAIFFFLSGPVDRASLPASPRLAPALTDSVFCADAATATPVPIELKFDVDTRIPNVLAVLPVPGKPLAPKTAYTCVVTSAVTGGGMAVQPSADWTSVRDGASADPDADAIHDPVVATLGAHGVAASAIAGMTVFTTQSTSHDLLAIQETVLPGQPVPTADFTSQPGLVFSTPAQVNALLGPSGHAHVGMVATGYYGAPRFQTHDPNGDGAVGDLPAPPSFITCITPCETNDERFTRDGSGTPIVIDTAQLPFTVVVPSGAPPTNGWPVIIQQHGLGGQRDTVVAFGELDAGRGFASIGIDAKGHGYRLFDCHPGAACSQDTANNFGGTAVPDGFADGSFLGFSVSFLATNLGFFEAFHNFVAIRDNFRQTYADLLSLVRLLHGHTIDVGLGTKLDDTQLYYMGHSLGGIMGSGFVPIAPDLQAAVLNATGGGLTSQLFNNSSIGAGALSLVQGILGLDPAQAFDQFSLQPNLTQMIIDPADGINSASLLLTPADGSPRNVIQVEDFGDQVVPNPSNEALAVAANLAIFDPYVQNLHQNPFILPIANPGTPKTVHGNAAGGTATAVLLQNGPATHAASLGNGPGTLNFVPEFAHPDDVPITGNGVPNLERGIRIQNLGIFDALVDWFTDILSNGKPGTFSLASDESFNPIQNADVPAGASTERFFARTVDAGGALAAAEPTPDVIVDFVSNAVATRVTAGRTILGTSPIASDADVPPGPASTVGTPGFLPFFVTLQRLVPGTFSAEVTIAYTPAELAAAGIAPGSTAEQDLVLATFHPGTCTVGGASCAENDNCGANGPCVGAGYTPFAATTVDSGTHTASAGGITHFSTFAVLSASTLATRVAGGGNPRTDCRAEWQVVNPTRHQGLDRRGRVIAVQTCHDGDPVCDADGAKNGSCTLRVGLCFNLADAALTGCGADTTTEFDLQTPVPGSGRALERANAQALAAVLTGLGGTQGGRLQNMIRFSPALAGQTCSAFAEIRVPLRGTRPGAKTLRGTARAGSGIRDRDSLKLRCAP